MTRFRLKPVLLGMLIVPACGMNGDCSQVPGPGGSCPPQAARSVILNITDAAGVPVPRAEVVYILNGGEPVSVSCAGNCDEFTIAIGRVGRFDIGVFSVGLAAQVLAVDVEGDETGCIPVTERPDVVMPADDTVAVLNGVWAFTNIAGQVTAIRFGRFGEPIGAILTARVSTGDTNVYISYNGNPIAGVAGIPILQEAAPMPTRLGSVYDWTTTSAGFPIGFESAAMTADFGSMTGTLLGSPATYTRLGSIPPALLDGP